MYKKKIIKKEICQVITDTTKTQSSLFIIMYQELQQMTYTILISTFCKLKHFA